VEAAPQRAATIFQESSNVLKIESEWLMESIYIWTQSFNNDIYYNINQVKVYFELNIKMSYWQLKM